LYNIKAVVHATGISPSTLRAWERRYQVCQPQRTESGYRLYSDRDLATIRWLKVQVDAGVAISQAVSWLENLAQTANGIENVTLPGNGEQRSEGLALSVKRQPTVRDEHILQHELLEALLAFDEAKAEQIFSEAFALYTLEFVGENLIKPILVELGERWHRGEITITCEHYATNYFIQRLAVLLRSLPNPSKGSVVWVACAPTEQHEIGLLLLTLYLRRAGHQVQFIGKDIPKEDFVNEVRKARPALILLSASTLEASKAMGALTTALSQIETQQPMIGYGGRIFQSYAITLQVSIWGIQPTRLSRIRINYWQTENFVDSCTDKHAELN
jgi:DNA-binding transcriptional MerR regulator